MSPVRTCLGCRQRDDQANLIRLVRVGDDVVDGTRPRLPGRGVYLHPGGQCLELAVRRRALERAFGRAATPPDEIPAQVGQLS